MEPVLSQRIHTKTKRNLQRDVLLKRYPQNIRTEYVREIPIGHKCIRTEYVKEIPIGHKCIRTEYVKEIPIGHK